jgi:hypothetical protein
MPKLKEEAQMILDEKAKRKLYRALIVASVAELLIIVSLFNMSLLQLSFWRALLGSCVVVTGVTLFYTILMMNFEVEKKFLRLAILANPSATMILAGIGAIVWDMPRYEWLFLICSFGAILSFLASFIFIIKNFASNR